MASNYKLKRWQDQLILLLGLWLLVSPWAFSYPEGSPQMLNAFVSGLVIAVLAAFDLYKTYFWAVVVNLLHRADAAGLEIGGEANLVLAGAARGKNQDHEQDPEAGPESPQTACWQMISFHGVPY